MVLYINIDSLEEVFTEAEVRQSYDDDMAQLAADGAAQARTYDQWLEEQCDLGLLAVDIDDLDEIMDE